MTDDNSADEYARFEDRYYAEHLRWPSRIETWMVATLAERTRCIAIIKKWEVMCDDSKAIIEEIERGEG